MKRIVFLFVNILICISAVAQRDFKLVQDSNFWLTSGNAAALTTFSVPSISTGNIFYEYEFGDYKKEILGKDRNNLGADIKSYTRLSDVVVVYGEIAYDNNTVKNVAGSMFIDSDLIKPFDLIEETNDNEGDKRLELFNLHGAVGWNLYKGLSLGASFDYTAGSYAKFRDLRHTNSLMETVSRINVYYSFGGFTGIGCDFIYRRRTETMKFETFGTTDKVFKTLVEYATGYGLLETYGGEGFTDDSHETPLFSELLGFSLQGEVARLFGEFSYMHRKGYYGKRSQYTVSHSNHNGNLFSWRLRYVLPSHKDYLCMFGISFTSEVLSTNRTNYRKVTSELNPSISYYDYYESTKLNDKARHLGSVGFTGYWKRKGEVFLWNVDAGINYEWWKQTAYIFPYIHTSNIRIMNVYTEVSKSFVAKNTNLLKINLGTNRSFGNLKEFSFKTGLTYQFHIRNSLVRPLASFRYVCQRGKSVENQNIYRHSLLLDIGVYF